MNQHGVFQRCLGLSLMLLATGFGALSVQASPEPTQYAVATPPSPAQESPPVTTTFETYTYGDLFSIQFPQGWEVSQGNGSLPLVITNFPQTDSARVAQTGDIRTEVTWIDKPPSAVVPQALQEIQTKGYTLADYGTLTIDNATALQVWLTNLPDQPTEAVVTYIGYRQGTAVISSRFSAPNPAVERQLITLHQSFTHLNP